MIYILIKVDADNENNAHSESQDLKSLIENEMCQNQARDSQLKIRRSSPGTYFEYPLLEGVKTVHFQHFEKQKYFEVSH